MTLKQAFTMWACAPRNTALAAKSREAVQKVLMKKYNDIELDQITETFARRLFSKSSESKEMKVKAASILVYLLEWGGDHGHCQRPTFTYEIAASAPEVEPEPTIIKVKPEALAKRQEELAAREQPKEQPKDEVTMEEQSKPTRGRQPKPVAQLDAKTLQVVKVWPSRSEAERELGACNIDRAINRKRLASGFFWCAPEDVDTFKPNPHAGVSSSTTTPKPKPSPVPKKSSLADFTDAEIVDEIKRRGWKGSITLTLNVDL